MAWRLLGPSAMLASRPITGLSPRLSGRSRALDAFVGSALELMIHAIEMLRDQLGTPMSRDASRTLRVP